MNRRFGISARNWLVVGALLFLTGVTSIASAQGPGLTESEKEWLTYMREEEKLARDVYLFLYDKWGAPVFNNIATSEQKHMNAIKKLLDRYGIPDPAADKGQGEFANPDLQDLYEELTGQGIVSLIEALKVGVDVEQADIRDLSEAIPSTGHKAIRNVYGNLLRGSARHLEAFVARLGVLRAIE